MDLTRNPRYAVRKLSRSPTFTLVAVLSLAVGIGANTAVFSVVDAVLLEPLPYPQSDQLVWINFTAPGLGYEEIPFSDGTFVQVRQAQHSFEDIALYTDMQLSLTGDGPPEQLTTAVVTPGILALLNVSPAIGREFVAEEGQPGTEPVVILSHGLWSRRFGAAPDILNRTVRIGGEARRVVGVAPKGFRLVDDEFDAMVPLIVDEANLSPGSFSLPAIARLRPGATRESARADLASLIQRFPEWFPEDLPASLLEQAQWGTQVRPLKERLVGSVRSTLWVVLGTVAFVLLIVCANMANLFLVRAESRGHELAVRTALGANRRELAGSFLSESVLLALAGGALGVPLAVAGLRGLISLVPETIPRLTEIGLDGEVLLFTAALSIATGLFFGSFPILRYRPDRLAGSLKDGARPGSEGRERRLARDSLVVVQVALALLLLVGSGLMIRSFRALHSIDPGFAADGVLTMSIALPESEYPAGVEVTQFWRRLTERLADLPGVEAVGAVNHLPLAGGIRSGDVDIEDQPVPDGAIPPLAEKKFITPGYFQALRIPVLEGRALEPGDGDDGFHAVVVNRSFAQHWWPEASALGKRIRLGEDTDWSEIVGVVADVRFRSLEQPPQDAVYFPVPTGSAGRAMSLAVRTGADPRAFMTTVRREVWAMDPNLPIADPRAMSDILADSMERTSFTMIMLGIAAAVALLLGTLGIYGVISYAVSRRTRELGIRIALGATAGRVRRTVVREGLVLAGAGVVIGTVAAATLSGILGGLLYEVSASDPLTYALVAGVLMAGAALASYVPARRASAIDPMEALRKE